MTKRQEQNISGNAHSNDWAVILAGGDGTRLKSLTRHIAGDERPKQFCSVLGRATLLDVEAATPRPLPRVPEIPAVLGRTNTVIPLDEGQVTPSHAAATRSSSKSSDSTRTTCRLTWTARAPT